MINTKIDETFLPFDTKISLSSFASPGYFSTIQQYKQKHIITYLISTDHSYFFAKKKSTLLSKFCGIKHFEFFCHFR